MAFAQPLWYSRGSGHHFIGIQVVLVGRSLIGETRRDSNRLKCGVWIRRFNGKPPVCAPDNRHFFEFLTRMSSPVEGGRICHTEDQTGRTVLVLFQGLLHSGCSRDTRLFRPLRPWPFPISNHLHRTAC